MKCSHCEVDLIEGANFCHSCGMPVKLEDERNSETSLKLVVSNLSAIGGHETYKLEDIIQLLKKRPDSVRKVESNEAGDVIFHIFTAWH